MENVKIAVQVAIVGKHFDGRSIVQEIAKYLEAEQ